jgi:hypothetical protein
MTCIRNVSVALVIAVAAGLFSLTTQARPAAAYHVDAPPAAMLDVDPVIVDAARVYLSLAIKRRAATGSFPSQKALERAILKLADLPVPADAHFSWHQLTRVASALRHGAQSYDFQYKADSDDAVFMGLGPRGSAVSALASEGVIRTGSRPKMAGVRVSLPAQYGTCGVNGYGWCQAGVPSVACWMNGVPGCEWCCSVNCDSCGQKAQQNGTTCYGCPPYIE